MLIYHNYEIELCNLYEAKMHDTLSRVDAEDINCQDPCPDLHQISTLFAIVIFFRLIFTVKFSSLLLCLR